MILTEIVNASLGCFYFGSYHASFLLALCAADATAKKRFPNEKEVGVRFKAFLRAHMPQLCGAQEHWVAVDMPDDHSTLPRDAHGMPDLPKVGDSFYQLRGRPRLVLMEGVLYHAFRCALSHEADLPEVELRPPSANQGVEISVDTKVRVSADIIGRLLYAVVHATENHGVFGTAHDAATPDGQDSPGSPQAPPSNADSADVASSIPADGSTDRDG